MKITVGIAIVCAAYARAQAQPEAAPPLTFEVASVKASAPGGRGGIIRQMPGGQTYIGNNVPVRLIMTVAYTVTDRLCRRPGWVATERFDLNAKAARPSTADELHLMLQRPQPAPRCASISV